MKEVILFIWFVVWMDSIPISMGGDICGDGYYRANPLDATCTTCEIGFYCHGGLRYPCPSNMKSLSGEKSLSSCVCVSDEECVEYHPVDFSMTKAQFIGSQKGIRKHLAASVNAREEDVIFETESSNSMDQVIKIQAFLPIPRMQPKPA